MDFYTFFFLKLYLKIKIIYTNIKTMKLQSRLFILFLIYFMIIVKHSKNNSNNINIKPIRETSGVWTETIKFV